MNVLILTPEEPLTPGPKLEHMIVSIRLFLLKGYDVTIMRPTPEINGIPHTDIFVDEACNAEV